MCEKSKLAKELYNSVFGNPWHGESVGEILIKIAADRAFLKPIPDAHNIIELTLHLTAWTEEVLSRLSGNSPALPTMGDWPLPADRTEEYWENVKQNYFEATTNLITAIKKFPDDEFDNIIGKGKNASLGTGFSYRGQIWGLVQHNAYHAGQIAIIKKAFR